MMEQGESSSGADDAARFKPYVPPEESPRELTPSAIAVGAILGIIFGASSVYLVLKVGLTVSASIPVAVLSITLFRGLSRAFGFRPATILENNIVQTAGSAGESIAFGVGVTMPALLLLGFEMSLGRIMVVSILGGLLGILMMIPLRRAFIVQQHKKLVYPEGTACAEVLIVGEKGGASAKTVFAGFGIGFAYWLICEGMRGFATAVSAPIEKLKGAFVGTEVAPHLVGVGYIIGPRIASTMVAGGVLAYLVIVPTIVQFASSQSDPTDAIYPGTKLVKDMGPGELRNAYILYIGAGAVATGGIISMLRVLPTIVRSARASLRDLRGRGEAGPGGRTLRTDRDLSMRVVLAGCGLLVLAIIFSPIRLLPPLTEDPFGSVMGAALIVFCGFLFVTVSSRLTGEIGSSSNPISGMTVATLLITCLVFLALDKTTPADRMAALSIAAIVCIAASNGGTTSQDLKTGFLVGGTPRYQQIAILIGALSSALVIGSVLKALNDAGTVYSKDAVKDFANVKLAPAELEGLPRGHAGGTYAKTDPNEYGVWNATFGNAQGVPPGKYLLNADGSIAYVVDPAINGALDKKDDGTEATKFNAPKAQLMALIIDGVLTQKLPWSLVLLGVLIAITLELASVPALPFAVGIYLPLEASMPIFLGGLVRWVVDKSWRLRTAQGEPDSGPGVLLASGYIAGGTIAGVLNAFLQFSDTIPQAINLRGYVPALEVWENGIALVALSGICFFLFFVGSGKLFSDPVNQAKE